MAFDLELAKTAIEDALNAAGEKFGPWLEKVKEAVHAVVETVHRQAVADETEAAHAVAGAVKTVEHQVTEDVAAAEHAVAGHEPAAPPAAE